MKKLINFSSSLLAVIAGLIFGLIILFITNSQDAVAGFQTILAGGFTDGISGIGQVLYLATPIIMTGLSVGFAFKTGLFNIGASGQFTMGAFAAIYIGIKGGSLGEIHWVVALIGAGIAGGIWGFFPGILKAMFNVNEVISSIMMNYIGMYFVNMLILGSIYDSGRNQSLPVKSTALIPKGGLDELFKTGNINLGILIALLFVIIIYILLEKTIFGYELKACGQNSEAAKYAGINSKKNITIAMVISGVLSGIGGGLLYLAGSGKYLQVVDIIAPEGFSGISVALLGLSNPIGILFSGIFIAHIIVGGSYLQLYNYVPEVIEMIISVIIYCGAFSLLFKSIITKILSRKEDEK